MNSYKSLSACLKLFPTFRKILRGSNNQGSVFSHPFPDLEKPGVLREEFILQLADQKRVLHFGFLDAPFSEEKIRSGSLLHSQLLPRAGYLFGVDIDTDSLALYRSLTGDHQNILYDIQSSVPLPGELIAQFDVILFPEVLEHLPEPGRAIQNLAGLCRQNPGSQLCLSVPNALSAVGFLSGLQGVELVHPDHYYYFSPYTLQHILQDNGFQQVCLYLYSSSNLLDSPGLTKHGILAVCKP